MLQYMGEVDQRRIQLHNQLDGTQTVHAIARVDFDDHSDQSGLSFKVGDRILVTGMNTNGTWKGRIGEKSGNFFASHVDFFEERENGAVLIQPEDINVLSLKQPFEEVIPGQLTIPADKQVDIASARTKNSYEELDPIQDEVVSHEGRDCGFHEYPIDPQTRPQHNAYALLNPVNNGEAYSKEPSFHGNLPLLQRDAYDQLDPVKTGSKKPSFHGNLPPNQRDAYDQLDPVKTGSKEPSFHGNLPLLQRDNYAQLNPVNASEVQKDAGSYGNHSQESKPKEHEPYAMLSPCSDSVFEKVYVPVTLKERPEKMSRSAPNPVSGVSLQDAIVKHVHRSDKAASHNHFYSNLSKGVHEYLNLTESQSVSRGEDRRSSDDMGYVKYPKMIATEDQRKINVFRAPFERTLTKEEVAFMRDTWKAQQADLLHNPDIPPVSLKLSLGDLESDILMRQVESEDSIVKGEENTRKSIPTPEMGNVLRGKEPFAKSLCPPEPGKRKYRSQLLQKLPKASNAPSHDSQVIKSPDLPKEVKYDPAPPRCYEWSKPTKKPQMSAPVPPAISEGGSYQNVEIKPIPKPRSLSNPPYLHKDAPQPVDTRRMELSKLNYENMSIILSNSQTVFSSDTPEPNLSLIHI